MMLTPKTILALIWASALWAVSTLGQTPTVASVSPGAASPGSVITLTGTHFAATATDNLIRFGATAVPATSGGTTSLTVTVPQGASFAHIGVSLPGGITGWSLTSFIPTFNPAGTLANQSFGLASTYTPPWLTPPSFPSYGKLVTLSASSSGPTQGVLSADFDGDGRPDAVFAGWNASKVYVFRNTYTTGDLTAGSFALAATLTAGSGPVELAVGDINGDGRLDLVCANSNASTLTVWENTSVAGTISFASPVTISIPFSANLLYPLSSVKLADIDGDGWLDIVVSGDSPGVLRNLGNGGTITTGSFAAPVVFPVSGGGAYDLVVEDFDGDGRLDLLTTGYPSKVNVLRNQSSAGTIATTSFATPVQLTLPGSAQCVAAADLDGDNRPEIIVGNLAGSISLFGNQSTIGTLNAGSFTSRVDLPVPGSFYPLNISVADLNGDGRVELIVSNRYSPGVLIGINRPAASLAASLNTFVSLAIYAGDAATGQSGRVAISDLNADGRPDLLVDGTSGSISISPSFVVPLTLTNLSLTPASVRATVPWRRYRTFSSALNYDDGSSVDVTIASTWTSSVPIVASISSAGLATALKTGDTVIGASFGSNSATATLGVDPIIMGTYAGSPDSRFLPQIDNQGAGGVIYAFALQSDGKIVIGGRFSNVNGVSRHNIARLNDDGSLDTSFDPGTGTDGDIQNLTLDAAGRVLIVGRFSTINGVARRAAARLLANGSLDTNFDVQFTSSTSLRANVVMARPGGQILIGGNALETTGVSGTSHLIQFTQTGARDSSFTAYGLSSGETNTLLLQPDGRVLVGGSFLGTTPSGLGLFCLTRLNTDGTRDTGFSHPISTSRVYGLARQTDGKLLVCGDFSSVQGQAVNFITRLKDDGTLDTSFSAPTTSGWGIVKAIALAPDGKIIVGKSLSAARLTTSGALDPTFDATISPDWDIYVLLVTPDEKILSSGGFTTVNGGPTLGIARTHGDVTTFAAWQTRYFSRADIDSNPAVTGPAGHPSTDEVPNLLRYANNIAPSEPAINPSLSTSFIKDEAGSRLQFTYRRLRATRDLVYEIGVSYDLIDWDYAGTLLQQIGSPAVSNDGLTEDVTAMIPVTGSRIFIRERVRLSP